MNIVIAIDSFKGSLSSIETGNITAAAIHDIMPDANTQVFPLAFCKGYSTDFSIMVDMGQNFQNRAQGGTGQPQRAKECGAGAAPSNSVARGLAVGAAVVR